MKYSLIVTCLFLFSCIATTDVSENELSEQEKKAAKDLIQGAFDNIWGGVDSTKISTYHTDDFIILENGEVWNNQRIKLYIRDQLSTPNRAQRKNMMEYISIEKYGLSMQIAYHNRAEFYVQDSLVGEGSWLESATAVKTDDGWRLKMMHSTWNKK